VTGLEGPILFTVGLFVTVAVFAAFAFLIKAELEDGRIAAADRAGEPHVLDDTVGERRAAAAERLRETPLVPDVLADVVAPDGDATADGTARPAGL
jgi:hypothetical protein